MELRAMCRTHKVTVIVLVALWAAAPCSAQSKKTPARTSDGSALVVVNGQGITEADLQRFMQTRQVPAESRDRARKPLLEEMIDVRLMKGYLASKKVSAKKEDIDQQLQQFKEQVLKGRDPDKALIEVGYTTETLRDEFALRLAWKRYIDDRLTSAQLQKYFAAHRAEFDGTRVRASQIIFKVPSKTEADFDEAEQRLTALRQRILDGKISFDEAARTQSDGPSKELGGDVGYFPYSGKMPQKFSREAFQLEIGDISPPFRSSFGVHLCLVTDRKPGDLSLEDVRDEVLVRMSQELWTQTIADLRQGAKIEWKQKL